MRQLAALVLNACIVFVVSSAYGAETEAAKSTAEKVKVGGYVQAKFVHNSDKDEDSFSVNRARLDFSGEVIENVHYKVEPEFGKGKPKLANGYINLTHWDYMDLTVGQFKLPYSPIMIISSSKNDLIDRPLITEALSTEYDIGAMAHGKTMGGRIGLYGGAWNGNGPEHASNDNDKLLYAARIAREALKDDEVKLTLGLNAYASEDSSVNLKNIGEFAGDRDSMGADAAIEYQRLMFKTEYHKGSLDPVAVTDELTGLVTDAGEFDVDGFFVRGGYMVLEEKLQAVAQYETFDNEAAHEVEAVSLGLNYFWAHHDHKAQLVYVNRKNGESESEVQAQIQVKF